MTKEELKEKKALYKKAKEAYYSGNPIMEDLKFDELEKELGLENKGYVGTVHSNTYTIMHPYIMGSLSKVQVHEDKEGNVNWEDIYNKIHSYVKDNPVLVTPKYDGCSFEIYVDFANNIKISGRGDGKWGKDIYKQIMCPGSLREKWLTQFIKNVADYYRANEGAIEFTFRGEALVSHKTFNEKYSKEYTNPRAFVAGCLNRDIVSDKDKKMCEDLQLKIYDFRYMTVDGWNDVDWTELVPHCTSLQSMNLMPSMDLTLNTEVPLKINMVQDTYEQMEEFRDKCDYALDGFVIKPKQKYRELNVSSVRPKDCVAIKFIPKLQDTTVVDIKWNLGKTEEWIPTIEVNPVIMDGKVVTKAAAHNYGYLIKNKICIGTKVQLSLAGDIIPFIYKVTDTSVYDKAPYEADYGITEDMIFEVDGDHAYMPSGALSEEDQSIHYFKHSALALNIPGLGPSQVQKVIDYIKEDCKPDNFFGTEGYPFPTHFLYVTPNKVEDAIGGKNGAKIAKEYSKLIQSIPLKDIIRSFNYPFCGDKVSEQIANMWVGLPWDFTSMALSGYVWAQTPDCGAYMSVMNVLDFIGRPIESFKEAMSEEVQNIREQIPVILTGEPNDYKSKGEFITLHPEYRVTGSWKEVKIVFTNSLDSNTGKMKKAREKGIEIRLY